MHDPYLVYHEHIVGSKLKVRNTWCNTSGICKQLSYHSQFCHLTLVSIPVLGIIHDILFNIFSSFLKEPKFSYKKPNYN